RRGAAAGPARARVSHSPGRMAWRLVARRRGPAETAAAGRRSGSTPAAEPAAHAVSSDTADAGSVGVAAVRGAARGVRRSAAPLHLRVLPVVRGRPVASLEPGRTHT